MNLRCLVLAASLGVLAPIADAAEGMWLFNRPPTRQLQEEHGFRIPDGWLEHLQQASVRLDSGGSGSFVSKDGLVLTNHHVGSGTIQKLSTRERDLLKDGFLDPEFMRRKLHAESEFRMKLRGGPEGAEADRAFDRIAQPTKDYQKEFPHYHLFEGGDAFNSTLFGIARTLLRAASEAVPPGHCAGAARSGRRHPLPGRHLHPAPVVRDRIGIPGGRA